MALLPWGTAKSVFHSRSVGQTKSANRDLAAIEILSPLTAEPHPFQSSLAVGNGSVKAQWVVLAEVICRILNSQPGGA